MSYICFFFYRFSQIKSLILSLNDIFFRNDLENELFSKVKDFLRIIGFVFKTNLSICDKNCQKLFF